MSAARALGHDADRNVRKLAFEERAGMGDGRSSDRRRAERRERVSTDASKERRKYVDAVEPTLRNNAITRKSLEAMQAGRVELFRISVGTTPRKRA